MESPTTTVPEAQGGDADLAAEPVLIEDELLIEEISIDGMCGVY